MADYTVDNLEIRIQASADKGILAMENLLKVTERVQEQLTKMNASVGSLNTSFTELSRRAGGLKQDSGKIVTEFKNIASESTKARTEVSSLNKELDSMTAKTTRTSVNTEGADSAKASKNFNTMFNVAKVIAVTRAVHRLSKVTIGSAIDMTENYNLFNVAMGDSVDKAQEFQQTLTSALGINYSESMRYQGFFKALATNMNIASDTAYVMSENLTKLIYDLSSLYNIDVDVAYGKLQSGIIGQTKPMRELGVDITAQTLQSYIDDFGWDTQIQSMTQAEKVMLRYIAVLDQTKLAQGDFARTINAPATQLRIFKQQVKETSAWIGTAFLGAVSAVLPYLNAFLSVVKEISKLIAGFFGFELGDFDFGGGDISGQLGDVSGGIDDVGSSAGKAKKQMQGLLGFEEIHNIQTPTASTGGAGGSGIVGGDGSFAKLLEEKLGGYDNLMGSISTKAQEISDNMMDWLGFTKVLGKWKWGGFWDMARGAQALTVAIGGLMLYKLGKWAVGVGNAFSGVVGTLTKGLSPAMKMATGGLVLLGAGFLVARDGAKVLARQQEHTAETTLKIVGGMASAAAGGALLGTAVLPGLGTAVGAVAGATVAGAGAFFGYRKEMKKIAYEAELFDGIGLPIEDYTGIVIDSMNAIAKAHDETVKWNNVHKTAQENIGNVTKELELMQIKMTNSAYKVTAEDIDGLANALERMANEVEISGEAFTNATIARTEKLVEEGKISRETADIIVANAIRKAEAEGEFMRSYTIQINELTKALDEGKISQEEYRVETAKLSAQFNETMNVAEDFRFDLELLTDEAMRKIDLKDWRNFDAALQDITATNEETRKSLRDGHRDNMANIEEQIKATEKQLKVVKDSSGEESQAYKDLMVELDALRKEKVATTETYDEESEKINTITAISLGQMVSQMHSTGEKMTDEAKERSEGIVKLLSDMGYDVDLETGIVSSVNRDSPGVVNAYGNLGKKSGEKFEEKGKEKVDSFAVWVAKQNPYININANTSGANTSVQNMIDKINQMNPKIRVGIRSDGSSLNVGTGVGSINGNISLRADGGLPPVGEMFIAREAGPEFVGRIGSSNVVANNQQIVDSVAKGVAQAVASVMTGGNNNQPTNLYLPNGSKFASWVVDEIDNLAMTTGKRFRTV